MSEPFDPLASDKKLTEDQAIREADRIALELWKTVCAEFDRYQCTTIVMRSVIHVLHLLIHHVNERHPDERPPYFVENVTATLIAFGDAIWPPLCHVEPDRKRHRRVKHRGKSRHGGDRQETIQ